VSTKLCFCAKGYVVVQKLGTGFHFNVFLVGGVILFVFWF